MLGVDILTVFIMFSDAKYCCAQRCYVEFHYDKRRYAELCHAVSQLTMQSIVRQSAIMIDIIMQSLALMFHYTDCHYAVMPSVVILSVKM
jgi:hypothetical protein